MSIPRQAFKKIAAGKRAILSSFRERRLPYTTVDTDAEYKKNIVFLLPVAHSPSGGNIVSHSFSDTINAMNYKLFRSQVFYPGEPHFNPTLFKNSSDFKRDYQIDRKKDIFIIPEMMAAWQTPRLKRLGVLFALNVQNGYIMHNETSYVPEALSVLCESYRDAAFITSISLDTTENIKFIFPDCAEKVIPVSYEISAAKLRPIHEKSNIITYMPRRLGRHIEILLFMLKDGLPSHWRLQAIDGVNEQEVYRILSQSKIFLSFSELEGIGMPPSQAALSGNLVIGYTGEGGKEYFHGPCFQEVACGDLRTYATKVLAAIDAFGSGKYQIEMGAIESLKHRFSSERKIQNLKNLIDRAEMALDRQIA